MKIFLIALLCIFTGSVLGRKSIEHLEDLDKFKGADFKIFEHDQFQENELCASLRCRKHEVCIVNDIEAMCIKKQLLSDRVHSPFIETIKKQNRAKSTQKYEVREHSSKFDDTNETKNAIRKSYMSKSKWNDKHRHHDGDTENSCSEKEIMAVGKRLLDWFSIIHKQEPQTAAHVPKHTVPCNSEVSWVFSLVDSNKDGKLSEHELGFIENDPHEHCLRPFLDRCDQDADDDISPDEWCDCFQYSGKERTEPLCHKAAHGVDPHLLGAFHPRCDVDGNYKPIQCHEGDCWCVDKFGREFDHSRVSHRKPDCGEFADEDDGEDVSENF